MQLFKITTLIFCLAFIATQCNGQLSGKISKRNSDSIVIRNLQSTQEETLFLDKEGNFQSKEKREQGYYALSDGKESTTLYIEPSYNLELEVNAQEFDETLRFKGKGEKENNYLAKKYLHDETLGRNSFMGFKVLQANPTLKEKAFLSLIDSIDGIRTTFLKQNSTGMSKSFVELEEYDLSMDKCQVLANYEYVQQMFTKNPAFNVSSTFPKAIEENLVLDEKYLLLPNYTQFLDAWIRPELMKAYAINPNGDMLLMQLNVIIEKVREFKIKEALIYTNTKLLMATSKNLDSVLEVIKVHVKDSNYLSELTHIYNKLKRLSPGMLSPDFSFEDLDGKKVTRNSLKGKMVYIDVWATWCGPCIAEMPALKKLEDTLAKENIYFVSICTKDSKLRWQEIVRNRNLGGIQLFASKENQSFFDSYQINGVPYFILLDEQGKIIERDAKRPSDSALLPQLKALLQAYGK